VKKDRTKRHPDNCPSCDGLGTTPDTEPTIKVVTVDGARAYKTEAKGSGCETCHGTGRVTNG
jgi:RecJ-like exonuclease